nr:MAG TPA: hypothetical protein [Microviridae sp.]
MLSANIILIVDNIDIYHNMYYLKFIFVYLPSNI